MRTINSSLEAGANRNGWLSFFNIIVILDTTVIVAACKEVTVFVNIDCHNFNVDEVIFCSYKDAIAKKVF